MLPKLLLIGFLLFVGFGAYVWADADSIQKTAISTDLILMLAPIRGYESTAKWFEVYRGEAPGHQSMITLVTWCTRNEESVELIKELSPRVLDRMAWAAEDSDQLAQWSKVLERAGSSGGGWTP